MQLQKLSLFLVLLLLTWAPTVRASNNIGTSVSKPVRLTILFPPRIVSQPSDVVVRQGAKAQFVVKSKGTKALSYQWFKDGKPIKGGNRNRIILNPVKAQDAGEYMIVVSNPVGKAESRVATLVLSSSNVLTLNPSDVNIPFTKWTDLEDLTDASATSVADGDDDGISNLLEYAFNGNPYSSDPSILPHAEAVMDSNGLKYMSLGWRESAEATNLTYQVQVSKDLTTWQVLDLEPYSVSRTENGGHTDVKLYLPVSFADKLFVRVAVTEE